MTIEELIKIADEKNTIFAQIREALEKHIRKTFADAIPSELMRFIKLYENTNSTQVEVKLPGEKRGHYFDLYYHTPYGKESRKLELNFGCFGSFTSSDECEITYCKAVAFFASHLAEIEQKLIFSEEGKKAFAEYDIAQHESYKAKDAVSNAQIEQKNLEDAAKKEEILKQIGIGCKIMTCKKTSWRDAIVKTIGSITAKNIIFKEDYGKRTKKDEFLANLCNGKWEIVK